MDTTGRLPFERLWNPIVGTPMDPFLSMSIWNLGARNVGAAPGIAQCGNVVHNQKVKMLKINAIANALL